MTTKEMVGVLMELKNAYPLFYSNLAPSDLRGIVDTWLKHLGRYDIKLVDKAVELMIAKETEVPTIALVNRYIPKAKEALKREAELADEELQERIRRLSK